MEDKRVCPAELGLPWDGEGEMRTGIEMVQKGLELVLIPFPEVIREYQRLGIVTRKGD